MFNILEKIRSSIATSLKNDEQLDTIKLDNILNTANELWGTGPGYNYDNYLNQKKNRDTNTILEDKRANELIIYITNNNKWNFNFQEFKYTGNDNLKRIIEHKKYEIECALVRESRLKLLVLIYQEYYNEKLTNPKRFIMQKDDDYLIDIYWKCQHLTQGSFADPDIVVKLTEEEYIRYFTNR